MNGVENLTTWISGVRKFTKLEISTVKINITIFTRTGAILLAVILLTSRCHKIDSYDAGNPKLMLPDPPNILWLVTEDMGPYISSFGDSTISTPNLNRLAAEGVVYPNLYSPSGVCAPSRAAIATGMYPSSFGANHMRTNSHMEITGLPAYEAVPPHQLRMLSEQLRNHGYYCTNNSKKDYQFAEPMTAWDESSSFAHWRGRDQGQPFFSVFNFMVTHESGLFEPYELKTSELRHYQTGDSSAIPLVTKAQQVPQHVSKETAFPIPPYLPDTELVRRDLWKMYNNIAEMDRQLGAILDQLEADGLLEHTIICFYADHGGPLPRQKRLLYDAGINAPLIIRYPDQQQAGGRDEQLISFIDFAPTVLSLAGLRPPEYLHGQAFLGEFCAKKQRQYIHAAADRFDGYTDVIRAVRGKKFKYIRNYRPEQGYYLPIAYREKIGTMQELLRLHHEGKLNEIQAQWFRPNKPTEELFDCESDPHELNNLALDPAYQDKLSVLRAEMDRWLLAIGDDPDLQESALIHRLWQGSNQQPKTSTPVANQMNGILSISCATQGASIGYKIVDSYGKVPKSWKIYNEPIKIPQGSELLIKAHRIGFKASEIMKYQLFL